MSTYHNEKNEQEEQKTEQGLNKGVFHKKAVVKTYRKFR